MGILLGGCLTVKN